MNSYQTVFTEEDFKNLTKEVKSEFYDVLDNIQFVKWLVADENVRGYAKNKKRWNFPNDLENRKENTKGKIFVDLTKPHILEGLDFFRERALFFDKHGKYTDIPISPNPKSSYADFWREELRRWKDGLVRPSDGEWIPGGLYFYWNYCPIWLVEEENSNIRVTGKKSKGSRVRKFPHPWLGDYLFYHYIEQARDNGQHCKMLKCRGIGASFKMGSMSPRNMFVYPGSGNPNFHLASDKTFLQGDKGVFGKVIDTLDWVADHTPMPKLRLGDSKRAMEVQLGYLDEYGVRRGLLSSVYGISLKDNPDKARGIRGPFVHYEEDGCFNHLEDAWNINRKSVEDGDVASGQMISLGTGGVEGANFAGSEKLFYNPSIYNIYGIPNVFDRNANGESVCGFFWGAYLNRNGCYDLVTGEPNVTKALYAILVDRYTVKKGSSDSRAITQKRAEECITPQDSIMRVEGSIFPVADLKDYLSEIMPNIQRFVAPHYVGNFTINGNGEVEFNNSDLVSVIREYPALDNKLGAVEIYEMPRGTDNQRFILGCLPTGEKVMTDVGLMGIEDVTLDHKLISESGKLVDIKNLQEYNVIDEDVYNIRVTNTFRTTTFTKEHSILVSKPTMGYVSIKKWQRLGITQRYLRFNFNYTSVSNIQKGDWLKVPNTYKEVSNFDANSLWINKIERIDRLIDSPLSSPDFWWFLGLWLGDDWCESDGYKISMSFNKKEQFYIDKYKRIVNVLFKRKVCERIRGNCVECYFSLQQLNTFLSENFGKYAHGKYIPEWAKRISHDLKKQLILGYIDSDGCIRKNKTGLYNIEIVSINLTMLESFQDILFSLGIVSGLSKLRDATTHVIRGRISKVKETYTIRISHHDTLNLVKLLDCYDDLKIKRIDFDNLPIVRRNPKYMCFFDENQDYIYFKISDITKSKYTGKVYNFECDTHTFMGHHITTHNCDVYDDDEVGYSDSLGSMIVFDRYTRRIVCEYTGRPQTANAFYEIVYRAARFYNATIMYENNKKGLYAYFNNIKKSLHLLADTPRLITDKQIISPKSNMNNTSKGINATAAINVYGRRLQADWMVEEAYKEKSVVDVIEENIVKETFVPNYRKIRSIGYLKECIAWSSEINTDRISAMNMVMIYDMELTEYGTNTQKQRTKTILDDPFFKRNGGVNYKNKSILQKGWNY